MRKLGIAIGLSLLAIECNAETATFANEQLTVPAVAVVDSTSGHYFANIQLRHEGEGMFRLVTAETRSLVQVEQIHIALHETTPRQAVVSIEGFKSVPCVELLEAAVAREGEQFTILLAESELGPEETCIAIPELITEAVTLDLTAVPAGDYTVSVNGHVTAFSLLTEVSAPQ